MPSIVLLAARKVQSQWIDRISSVYYCCDKPLINDYFIASLLSFWLVVVVVVHSVSISQRSAIRIKLTRVLLFVVIAFVMLLLLLLFQLISLGMIFSMNHALHGLGHIRNPLALYRSPNKMCRRPVTEYKFDIGNHSVVSAGHLFWCLDHLLNCDGIDIVRKCFAGNRTAQDLSYLSLLLIIKHQIGTICVFEYGVMLETFEKRPNGTNEFNSVCYTVAPKLRQMKHTLRLLVLRIQKSFKQLIHIYCPPYETNYMYFGLFCVDLFVSVFL